MLGNGLADDYGDALLQVYFSPDMLPYSPWIKKERRTVFKCAKPESSAGRDVDEISGSHERDHV